MTWVQPWGGWFLAGIPVVILLYLLRVKRRHLSVSTLMFWRLAQQESGRGSFFRKFRNLLSLLLHLLVFLLLVAALARPVLQSGFQTRAATVVILDLRARMQAVDESGRSRFDEAVRIAHDYIHQAGEGRDFLLLTLAGSPAVAHPFTSDPSLLTDALGRLSPTDAGGELTDAVSLAQALLGGREGTRRIAVLTTASNPVIAKSNTEVILHSVGSPRDNAAVTRFATRSLPSSPETMEVLFESQNYGAKRLQTEVEFALDGRTLEVKPLALAPGEKRTEVLTSVPRPIRGAVGWLTARIRSTDALERDNIAYATLPPLRQNRVLLVSRGNVFLEKVLAVDTSLKFQFVTPETYQPAMDEKFEVVIYDGSLPASFEYRKARGNFLFVKTSPFHGIDGPLDFPVVTSVDPTHPTTRLVQLQNVVILRAHPLTLPDAQDGWTFSAPIQSGDRPLLITGENGGRRIAALAFDVMDSDLPLRVGFPLLIHSTINWLAGSPENGGHSISAGEVLQLPSGARVDPVAKKSASDLRPMPQGEAVREFFRPLQNGYYALAEGDSQRWLAVNTFSPAESDLRPGGTGASVIANLPPLWITASNAWAPWRWLALFALLVMSAEWFFFHRRKTE